VLHTKPPQTPSDALRAALVILRGIGGHAEHVWEAAKLFDDVGERLSYLARAIDWLRVKTQEDIWRVPPVNFTSFCIAPRLLNKNGILWPMVLEAGEQINSGRYTETLLTGAIGVAKTTLAIYTQAYQLYTLSCLINAHEMFDLDPSSEITIIFQSINKNLAKDVDFRRFRDMVQNGPYFQRQFMFDDSRESEMRFPRNFIVKPVAGSDTAAIGQNVIGGIIDEVNFMAVVEDSKMTKDGSVYDQAMSNYTSIARRRESRFMQMGQLPGMLCLVSSRNYPGQFSDHVEERAKRDPKIYVYDKRLWEIRPERFGGEWFRVFVGDDSRKPRLLDDDEIVAPQDERLVWRVPAEYRTRFEDNTLPMIRDVLGLSTMALFPFMTNADAVAKCFGKVQPLASLETCDFVFSRPLIYPKRMEHPEEPRFVHIDFALSKDSAGVAVAHVPRFVPVQRGDYRELLPIIQFDLILEVAPPRGGEIEFSKIRELIYFLRNKVNMPIKWVTFDQFQSNDSRQIMQREGFATGYQSMDVDTLAYDVIKQAFYDDRVIAATHRRALKEMLGLEFDPKKNKVDHPPHGSKDVSDAMAGAAVGLMKQRATWVRHKIPANSIPSFLLTKGKNEIEERKKRLDKLSYMNRVRAERGLVEIGAEDGAF
jgi:hypothetical protein